MFVIGKTVKQKCAEIMEVVYKKDPDQISLSEIVQTIRAIAGFDRNTKKQYLEALVFYGYLKSVGIGVFRVVPKVEREFKLSEDKQ